MIAFIKLLKERFEAIDASLIVVIAGALVANIGDSLIDGGVKVNERLLLVCSVHQPLIQAEKRDWLIQ